MSALIVLLVTLVAIGLFADTSRPVIKKSLIALWQKILYQLNKIKFWKS